MLRQKVQKIANPRKGGDFGRTQSTIHDLSWQTEVAEFILIYISSLNSSLDTWGGNKPILWQQLLKLCRD